MNLFAATGPAVNINSRGYAAVDTSGKLVPWEFERRPVGDNDILIDIKYASICHSDIHQMKGHWGPQQYPQVPGHEIVGIVTAVGKNVTKFKVGDRAGVGCMVDSCQECQDCKGEEEQCTAPKPSSPTATRRKARPPVSPKGVHGELVSSASDQQGERITGHRH
jgi:alcohol dehydrogenase (NADP+)/uncharacterized zinc-type alcohol dehydrogenase-like protein